MHSHGVPAPEDTPGRTAHSDTYNTPKGEEKREAGDARWEVTADAIEAGLAGEA